MDISVDQLRQLGMSVAVATRFAPHLPAAFQRFAINTPQRAAAFLAQCHVESAAFTRLTENLNYRSIARLRAVWPSRFRSEAAAAPYLGNPERLANRVYAGRLGNGPESSGDGWRFRGRGLKQLTGRDNYTRAAAALGRPYVQQPELLEQPADAVLTAAWYWHSNGLNALADTGNHDGITRRVNGPAMLAAADRRNHTQRLLTLFA